MITKTHSVTPRGWIVRYTSGRCVTLAWRRTRREALAEAARWPGATVEAAA
jgi:hypothetical protein